jgi:hypothetical protein
VDWLGFFVPRVGWRRQPAESLSPPHADDLERLHWLRDQGSRLRLPHPVRAFLVFDAEGAARAVVELLAEEGFGCTVRAAPGGAWVVTAVTRVVPTPGALTKLRERCEAMSALHGGTYRGWDAPAVY